MIIEIHTSDNDRTATLLDFFVVLEGREDGCVNIKYEDIDQISSICRILVDAEIDIFSISVIPTA